MLGDPNVSSNDIQDADITSTGKAVAAVEALSSVEQAFSGSKNAWAHSEKTATFPNCNLKVSLSFILAGVPLAPEWAFLISEVTSDNRRILNFFEKGLDNLWGPTQTLVVNNARPDSAVSISETAAVSTGFQAPIPFRDVNITATGMILGCNTTGTTTTVPPYGYSYYSRYSRHFRRARCPKWCAAKPWWYWRCRHCGF